MPLKPETFKRFQRILTCSAQQWARRREGWRTWPSWGISACRWARRAPRSLASRWNGAGWPGGGLWDHRCPAVEQRFTITKMGATRRAARVRISLRSRLSGGFLQHLMNGLSGGCAFALLKLRRLCAQRGECKISLRRCSAAAALGAPRHVSAVRCRRNKANVAKWGRWKSGLKKRAALLPVNRAPKMADKTAYLYSISRLLNLDARWKPHA